MIKISANKEGLVATVETEEEHKALKYLFTGNMPTYPAEDGIQGYVRLTVGTKVPNFEAIAIKWFA